jgi:hypothetical protein
MDFDQPVIFFRLWASSDQDAKVFAVPVKNWCLASGWSAKDYFC